MKISSKVLLFIVLAVVLGSTLSVLAGKPRKLPAGSYITTARIEILSGDEERYKTAIAMLDSLIMHYGPHSEGYFWMNQLYYDFIAKRSDLKEKLPYVELAVVYADSIRYCCDNKKVPKKYRKDCQEQSARADSTMERLRREFYHDGVEQIKEITQISEDLKAETDSISIAYYKERRAALVDSCKDNMVLAIAIDPSDPHPYIGLASGYEKSDDYETALVWLKKALDKADERDELLRIISYDHISLGQYCECIPYFREFIDIAVQDSFWLNENRSALITDMNNLTICYNNCKMFDSGYVNNRRILAMDPENT
ncbi:MAG: hypothetical protein KKA42_14870, partial [candidate division Zixibacteria bacterium]|nr:hypothetical protein [candidate division Zixibacteria bacterium]